MGEPTFQDVAYGDHERDVVDLYQADSEGPTPVYMYIHGGGFRSGDKAGISQVLLKGCLEFLRRSIIRFQERTRRRWSTAGGQFSLSGKAEEWNLDASRWRLEVDLRGPGFRCGSGFAGKKQSRKAKIRWPGNPRG